jgi:5-formyltetrahydrofolate cyclo-ligase
LQAREDPNTNGDDGSVHLIFPLRPVSALRVHEGGQAWCASSIGSAGVTSLSKADLRREARQTRKALVHADISAALAAHAAGLKLTPGAAVGGYHALPEEADPALLLQELVAQGAHIAFPRIAGRDVPLDFHLVPDGEILREGAHGIHEPLPHWPSVTPELLLVPLLAFDSQGHRLGYGGGFYDRTIRALRVPAIGIAYAAQEIASLPAEPHDMALTGVITELGFRTFS